MRITHVGRKREMICQTEVHLDNLLRFQPQDEISRRKLSCPRPNNKTPGDNAARTLRHYEERHVEALECVDCRKLPIQLFMCIITE